MPAAPRRTVCNRTPALSRCATDNMPPLRAGGGGGGGGGCVKATARRKKKKTPLAYKTSLQLEHSVLVRRKTKSQRAVEVDVSPRKEAALSPSCASPELRSDG